MVWVRIVLLVIALGLVGCKSPQFIGPEIEKRILLKKQRLQDLQSARSMLLKAIVEQEELLAENLAKLKKSKEDILSLSVQERTEEQASLLPQIEERLRVGIVLAKEIAILKLMLQARMSEVQKSLESFE